MCRVYVNKFTCGHEEKGDWTGDGQCGVFDPIPIFMASADWRNQCRISYMKSVLDVKRYQTKAQSQKK
jgi:hypothetical protein